MLELHGNVEVEDLKFGKIISNINVARLNVSVANVLVMQVD